MSLSQNTSRTPKEVDCCPNCHVPFEIVRVKFRVPPTLVFCCPNCALALEEVHCVEAWNDRDRMSMPVLAWRYLSGSYARWSMNWRFRFTLLFVIAAVLVAAMLRHTVHVYGGISPEEMRAVALLLIPIAALAMMLMKKR